MNPEMAVALRKPFDPKQVGKLPKVTCGKCSAKDRECDEHRRAVCKTCKAYIGKHIHIDFVGHAHVTDRLLQVDEVWSWEPVAFTGQGLPQLDENGGLWIRLTVQGVTRLGYGHAGQKRGGDAVKEVIGDALRNAAMRFGVALDLWMKETPVEPAASDGPVLSPIQAANQMRNVILAIGKKRNITLPAIDGDFHQWSRAEKEFRTAELADLELYKQYLEAQA